MSLATLLCLEARVVGGDAPFPWIGAVGLAFLLRREAPNPFPSSQICGSVLVDGMSVEVRQRRRHQIPDDQSERGGVAGFHACHLAEAPGKPKGRDEARAALLHLHHAPHALRGAPFASLIASPLMASRADRREARASPEHTHRLGPVPGHSIVRSHSKIEVRFSGGGL